MSKLVEWTRWMLLEAKLAAPPIVQRTVIPHLYEVKDILGLLIKPYLTTYQWRGRTEDGTLTVSFAGREFTRMSLKSSLFTEGPVEKMIGRVPLWSLDKLADSPSDLIIVEAPRCLIRKLPRQSAIVLPRVVNHIVDVGGDWQDVRSRFRKNTRKYLLRLMRKYGYEYDVSHDCQEFEQFYHHMYVPTMRNSHGELCTLMTIQEAYRYFRHGWLFRVIRDGDWVSGMVCHSQQEVLFTDIIGVKNSDAQLMKEGAESAAYYAVFQWANQHKYKAVNMLWTRPYIKGGTFQHKRRWGAAISVPLDFHKQFWIKARHNTPPVSKFLIENPCVIVDENAELHGLIIVADPYSVSAETRQEWEKTCATPGLNSLLIRPVSDFAKGPRDINDPNLVIPGPFNYAKGGE